MEQTVSEVKQDRGILQVDLDECKGCGLCVEACPTKVIRMSEGLNHYGYRTATYQGAGCSGCGICFMVCPEPGAITVMKIVHHPIDKGHVAGQATAGAAPCKSN